MRGNISPKRIYFEEDALDFKRGGELYDYFKGRGIPVLMAGSHNRKINIPGESASVRYAEAKDTWVFGVRRSKTFQTCKPSAHFQLPLFTSCPGMCVYCYLSTTLGRRPYVRAYVNVEEILSIAGNYIQKREPEETIFEGAATSDPLPLEPYTGALKEAILFFSRKDNGYFRFVTKFTEVDSLLTLPHGGKTRFRFSLNHRGLISRYELRTPGLDERIEAAAKVAGARYAMGFLIAPVFLEGGWKQEYRALFEEIEAYFRGIPLPDLTFEFVTHRFTSRAKKNILEFFPSVELDMDEKERVYKYGQFGYGKYVYPKELFNEAKKFFYDLVGNTFPEARVDYFV